MSGRHTSGPWVSKHVGGSNFAVQEFDIRGTIGVHDHGTYPIFNRRRGEINGTTVFVSPQDASLIAAAPDLLEAVKALLPEGWGEDDTMDHMPGVKQARAAIAKAEGRS